MNAFDGSKVLYHVAYWSQMEAGVIPPPVLATVDPIGACNLKCEWCNGKTAMERAPGKLSDEQIDALPGALAEWGVRAVCIAGGGEPTMHPRLGRLIEGFRRRNVQVGVVTNGTMLGRVPELVLCRWVGVSVDAGCRDTYRRLKGVDRFEDVIEGMRTLRSKAADLELTYKFLLTPENIADLPSAACFAASLKCSAFHARPAGRTWTDVADGRTGSLFTAADVTKVEALMYSVGLDLKAAGVPAILSAGKFEPRGWAPSFKFHRCHAVGMTCVINATEVGLCCDRRGDPRTKLCDWTRPADIVEAWGGARHRDVMEQIKLSDCPRCTYAPHNELYEQFVTSDPHCKDFI
jgi:pyruvate-formate lyase-activating enzyme